MAIAQSSKMASIQRMSAPVRLDGQDRIATYISIFVIQNRASGVDHARMWVVVGAYEDGVKHR